MHARSAWAPAVVAALLLAGCGSGSSSTTGAPPTSPDPVVSSATGPAFVTCPYGGGGLCVGALDAGRHRSRALHPALTYSVPGGWDNPEDLEANYELLPPGATPPAVEAGDANYIGVYRDVALEDGCATGPVAGLVRTPAAYFRHLSSRPDLVMTRPRPAHVGGLSGLVADLHQAPTWRRTCPYSGGRPLSSVLVGIADAQLDHPILPRQTMRLYLLQFNRTVLAVEVEDVHTAGTLTAYSRIVRTFHFATGQR
jgi:hypothetical protein